MDSGPLDGFRTLAELEVPLQTPTAGGIWNTRTTFYLFFFVIVIIIVVDVFFGVKKNKICILRLIFYLLRSRFYLLVQLVMACLNGIVCLALAIAIILRVLVSLLFQLWIC